MTNKTTGDDPWLRVPEDAREELRRRIVADIARAESSPAHDVLADIVGPAVGTAGEKCERITADEWWSRQMAKLCRAPVACNREAPSR